MKSLSIASLALLLALSGCSSADRNSGDEISQQSEEKVLETEVKAMEINLGDCFFADALFFCRALLLQPVLEGRLVAVPQRGVCHGLGIPREYIQIFHEVVKALGFQGCPGLSGVFRSFPEFCVLPYWSLLHKMGFRSFRSFPKFSGVFCFRDFPEFSGFSGIVRLSVLFVLRFP